MKEYKVSVLAVVLVVVFSFIFYKIEINTEIDKIFLSVATFLFSIFTGFFISRQAARYNKVREVVSAFDGKMTSIYRTSAHISGEMQKEVGNIISKHYKSVLDSNKWDYHFGENKSTTITSIDSLLDKYVGDEKINNLKNQSVGVILKCLAACQDIRKQIVALREERIPFVQWLLIYFFVVMLLITVSFIDSYEAFFGSVLKAAFLISIISVVFILYRLNSLKFSESLMGEHSARDVLDIVRGVK